MWITCLNVISPSWVEHRCGTHRMHDGCEETDEHVRLHLASLLCVGVDVRRDAEHVLLERGVHAQTLHLLGEEREVRVVVFLFPEVRADVGRIDRRRGRKALALVERVMRVRGAHERWGRAERVDREEVVRRVAAAGLYSAHGRAGESGEDALVEVTVVEVQMERGVVGLEPLDERGARRWRDARQARRRDGRGHGGQREELGGGKSGHGVCVGDGWVHRTCVFCAPASIVAASI
jgi:hypothetical protein